MPSIIRKQKHTQTLQTFTQINSEFRQQLCTNTIYLYTLVLSSKIITEYVLHTVDISLEQYLIPIVDG